MAQLQRTNMGRKKHGPKRRMWHYYEKAVRVEFGKLGLLTKYNDYDSWKLALMARGVKTPTLAMWVEFSKLTSKDDMDKYYEDHDKRKNKKVAVAVETQS